MYFTENDDGKFVMKRGRVEVATLQYVNNFWVVSMPYFEHAHVLQPEPIGKVKQAAAKWVKFVLEDFACRITI